ncbi:MAG: nitrous oxide reductase family maturation protein NosD [Acidobacteria bacterium]|nr:MAG: nitrous oxide reductase family maturation protein NosD [Acidobacteriota bacterium]
MSNIEYRMSNVEVRSQEIIRFGVVMAERRDQLRHSTFDIRYSTFGFRRITGKFAIASTVLWLLVVCVAGDALPRVEIVGQPGARYSTVQAALDAAQPRAVIRVYPGTYNENLILRKTVKLEGVGRPVIRGTGQGSIILITADSCEVRGLVIEHSGGDLQAEDSGILVKSRFAVLQDNRLRDVLYGIYLFRAKQAVIRNNTISGRPELELGERGAGLHFWDSPDNTIEDNTLFDVRDGFYIQSSPGNQIRRNKVFRVRYGVHYMFSDRNSFEDNVFSHGIAGAAIMYSSDIQFRHNAFIHNRGFSSFGILFQDCERCVAERNLIVDNATGIFMEALITSVFRNNVIGENDVALQMFSSAEGNLFAGNNFIQNLSPLQLIGTSTTTRWTELGKGNYWSNYSGYDLDANGIGDIPHKIQNVFEYMEGNHPRLRLFLESPAAQAIATAERIVPLVHAPSVSDTCPLMRAVTINREAKERPQADGKSQTLLAVISALMLSAAVQTIRWGQRR